MQQFRIIIDGQNINVLTETGERAENAKEILEYISQRQRMYEIGEGLMQNDAVAKDPAIVNSISDVVRYYYAEEQNFVLENSNTLLRLALGDIISDEDENAENADEIPEEVQLD